MLTSDEKIVEDILWAVENGNSFLLHGPGGTGKSHLIRRIAREAFEKGKRVACTAATGIAAINLSVPEAMVAGCTIHSWAGVGLADKPPMTIAARVGHDQRAIKRWKETNVLIIDEISMIGAEFLDILDYVGRFIRDNHETPFGGIQIVFSGDFLQLPPVKSKWVFTSKVWKDIEPTLITFILETPKRYPDREWFDMLLRFRKQQQNAEDIKFLKSRHLAYQKWVKEVLQLKEGELIVKPTILNSKRIDVDLENDQELEKLKTPIKEFVSEDVFISKNSQARQETYFKQLDDAIPKQIYLKVGAQVMLKANLDIPAGLANGSRGVVKEIFQTGVIVKWYAGHESIVGKNVWIQEDKHGKASRGQIPLILAWSLTIHKVQGCTLDTAVCNLGTSIFCPGQAYVAASRVRSSEGLYLSDFYPPSIRADPEALDYVENIENVYVEDELEENPDGLLQQEDFEEEYIEGDPEEYIEGDPEEDYVEGDPEGEEDGEELQYAEEGIVKYELVFISYEDAHQ